MPAGTVGDKTEKHAKHEDDEDDRSCRIDVHDVTHSVNVRRVEIL